MKNLEMYCLGLYDQDLEKIKSLNYIPVGLGKETFREDWLSDSSGINISHKNSSYGEYTFHYWFWKNKLKKLNNDNWIGFCAYRRFWAQNIDCKELKKKKIF